MRQGAFRVLGNYEIVTETARTPNLRIGFGVQGIGTGNPGYFSTSEKNFRALGGTINGFLGFGLRANESHGHLLGGAKFTPTGSPFTFGFQNDGHETHPLVTYTQELTTLGIYWVGLRGPGFMVSRRF